MSYGIFVPAMVACRIHNRVFSKTEGNCHPCKKVHILNLVASAFIIDVLALIAFATLGALALKGRISLPPGAIFGALGAVVVLDAVGFIIILARSMINHKNKS
ncbi:MAG: hypothetical protein H7A36_02080 [Chlamydiales bacterium]|nr:hypothetical protein [Chlamydiales bacterium]